METTHYRNRGHYIQGRPAVSLPGHIREGVYDKMLSGSKGFISENGTRDTLSCYLVVRGGNEKKVTFSIKDLKVHLKRIGYSARLSYQLQYANNPNSRHKGAVCAE